MNEQIKLIEGIANDLLAKSKNEYQKCKIVLLSQITDNVHLRDFICKLFDYTDKRRTLLISMND